MSRIKAVDSMIRKLENEIQLHQLWIQQKQRKIEELKEYKYTLTKPGFKTKGWNRHTKRGRTEPYVITSSNTHE